MNIDVKVVNIFVTIILINFAKVRNVICDVGYSKNYYSIRGVSHDL